MYSHDKQPISSGDPHGDQPVVTAGPPPEEASAILILIHGRGATADSMLQIYRELGFMDVAAVAPQAADNTWYPFSFLVPIEDNQPYLESALTRVESIVLDLLARGLKSERIALLGFSQGACVTAEFAARHPRRYGALMILTGGLVGPDGTARDYPGSLGGTPVFIGTSDPDPHVPFDRVVETHAVLTRMGADVELRSYKGMAHTINEDELNACAALVQRIVATPTQEL